MLELILHEARTLGASDVHLAVGYQPVMRLSGKLKLFAIPQLTQQQMTNMLLKLPLEVRQKLERNGEVDAAFTDTDGGRCRLNFYRQNGQYAAAIRILPTEIPTCESLGLPQAVQKLAELRHGLILVAGTTGSGKSTTLAAIVELINNSRAVHILTLEDPVEYVYKQNMALINQREIGHDTKSFASGLRSALRQDPDVILVGEMRDMETMSIALTAAETGHLVLATLHTGDAVSTVNRFIDALPDKQLVCNQLAECLQAVVCQRLIVRADGNGLAAAFEVLLATSALRSLIRSGQTQQLASYIQTGKRYGMQTMDESLQQLRIKGII